MNYPTFSRPHRPLKIDNYDIKRFWSKVHITCSDDDCWEWKGNLSKAGYGTFILRTHEGKTQKFYAHRVGYAIQVEDPLVKVVCHKCDNRKCVRGSHLWVGTSAENIQDAGRKRRMGVQTKPQNYKHVKLNYELAAKIRACVGTHREIAKKFGLSVSVVGRVRTGKSWA